jgi:hypothetical protein
MYHPSSYAKMLDAEWIEVKAKVIADLNAAKAEIEETLVIFVYPIHKKLNPWLLLNQKTLQKY